MMVTSVQVVGMLLTTVLDLVTGMMRLEVSYSLLAVLVLVARDM